MTVRDLIEQRGKKLRGAAREGVEVALQVLDECRCETCRRWTGLSGNASYGFCNIEGDDSPKGALHSCSWWEARP